MKIITITGPAPGYTAHEEGRPILAADRLAHMRAFLCERLDGIQGKIVYQRPSWPGRTSPVTLLDSRPQRGYVGGHWSHQT